MHSRKEGAAIREEVYRFIAKYITVHAYPPSYKEIADALGISISTVRRHIKELIKELIDEEILETDAEPGTQRAFRIRGTRVGKRGKEHE